MAFLHDNQGNRGIAVSIFSAVAKFFDQIADAQNRSAEVVRMQNLSDSALRDLGVNRANIVRHVYRDYYDF